MMGHQMHRAWLQKAPKGTLKKTRSLFKLHATLASLLMMWMSADFNAFAFPVQIANAPQNDLALSLAAIRSAKKSLLINIYELTQPAIAEAIIERIHAGIHVEILQEGQPAGGFKEVGRELESQIAQVMNQAGKNHKYFEMKNVSKKSGSRRFRYDHAKYIVVDSNSLLVSSENFSTTGHPLPNEKGNRGWEAFLHEPTLAHSFMKIFAQDTDPSYGDLESQLERFYQGSPLTPDPLKDCFFFCFTFDSMNRAFGLAPLYSQEQMASSSVDFAFSEPEFLTVEASSVEQITSPETSLSGLLKMIRSAKKTLDLEQMNFHMEWKELGDHSPLFDAVVEAAERGVRVRVLLNDETAFFRPPARAEEQEELFTSPDLSLGRQNRPHRARVNKNLITVEALNEIAEERHLPLEARIADVRAMGVSIIHNKGALVDGNQTLISSINWNENSVIRNREAAVLLDSPKAYAYFSSLFQRDWKMSEERH